MDNIKATLKGNKLHLEIDLSERLGDSSSGKSVIIASTGGNVALGEMEGVAVGEDQVDISLGLNCYIKKGKKK